MEISFLQDSRPTLYRKLFEFGLKKLATILILDDLELQEILHISKEEVLELKNIIIAKINIQERLGTVSDTRLSTGCEQINSILWGGLPTVRILEVFGCAGSGKTQFCLQLLLMVQLPRNLGGLDKKAVYICTEPPFPSRRFHQMCELAPQRFNIERKDMENNVFIHTCFDIDDLLVCLNQKLPILIENFNIGLIIIDTIAAAFRGDDRPVNYIERCLQFQEIVTKLRLLARASDAAILCVNQVANNLETNQMHAALGPSWSSLVAQRYQISRVDCNGRARKFSIIHSYECEPASVEFDITDGGIV